MSYLRSLAVSLSRETGRSTEVIEYGLKVGLYNLAGFTGVATLGYLLGVLPYAVTAYVASGTLRLASGGGHTATPARCILLTSVQFAVVGLISCHIGPYVQGLTLAVISGSILFSLLYAIVRFAPRDVPNKPISQKRGQRLKRWAVAVWLLWAGIISWAQMAEISTALVLSALLGMSVQGLALMPWTYSIKREGGD